MDLKVGSNTDWAKLKRKGNWIYNSSYILYFYFITNGIFFAFSKIIG